MLAAMTVHPEIVVARWRGHGASSDSELAGLLAAYHLQTEAEKGSAVVDLAELPERYRAEVLEPSAAFADDIVLVAMSGGVAVGCAVVTAPAQRRTEIKRLWVDPAVRGRGVASALVKACLEHAADVGVDTVRLSVWAWRTDALRVYERIGFTVVDSWDSRDRLVCMEQAVHPSRIRS